MGAKYNPYPCYTETNVEWLGSIPQDWTISRIKFLAALNSSKSELSQFSPETEASFLPMEAIGERGTLDLSRTKALKEVVNGYTYLREGDICIAKITPCFENGKGAILSGLTNRIAFGTTELIPLRCTESCNSKFLYYLLTSSPFNKLAEGSMYGAGGQKRVSDSFVANYHLSAPPLPEQQKIADFLDYETAKIDRLIAKQQQLIELLKEKRQAVISHAVTKGLNPNMSAGASAKEDAPLKPSGVEWLGDVPEHWTFASLKHYSRVNDCKHITAEFLDEGIPLASIGEVKEWTVNLSNAKRTSEKFYLELIEGGRTPQSGDIIYTRNATVGEAALVTEKTPKFAMGQDVCLIRLNSNFVPEYILHVLKSKVVSAQLDLAMIGSTFKRINVDKIRSFLIPVPPLAEQQSIVDRLEADLGKLDSLVSNATTAIKLMKERRTALISAAVTGKFDVRDWQAPTTPETEGAA